MSNTNNMNTDAEQTQNFWTIRAENLKQSEPEPEPEQKVSELETPINDDLVQLKELESLYFNTGKGGKSGKGGKGGRSGKGGKGGRGGKGTKNFSPEEMVQYENKIKSFNSAQEQAINKCLQVCNLKLQETINNSIMYEVNYSKILKIDTFDDDIVIDDKVYSLKRFLDNKKFQYKLRDEYKKLLPDVWISLFPGRDENTYCIRVQKQK